ncbi:hypothetical protein [Nonomuraea diastatica]|uniref:Uncharacterized protein n=1 Tax=Nonomuraea diastatica TaxID=1848329 RepID=A0A4R4X6S0_9ACTN|nr:hypothetical protein [Nonomuraea diastatica]TDD25979.1 hypothetical protein E1294_01665 [Nonomuraea diastatica]
MKASSRQRAALAHAKLPARSPSRRRSRTAVLLAGAAAVAGIVIVRAARSAPPNPDGWFAVTVETDPALLTGPDRPDELARLAERHEIRIGPAPGGRGSEIAVREADGETRDRVRKLKQLLETGEVLLVDRQPEGHRTALGRVGAPAFRHLTRKGAR